MELKKLVGTLLNIYNQAKLMDVDFSDDNTVDVGDFKGKQHLQKKKEFFRMLGNVETLGKEFKIEEYISDIRKNLNEATLDALFDFVMEIPDPHKAFVMPENLPVDIRDDIDADGDEVNKCFNAKCYRSAVILCGRILETALHRKYYDVSGNDLLEKSPGLGLGNLIGKISEKGVTLDPGLGNQIHLINQVRIHSVHKKQELFLPSKEQTQAIILYTFDIVGRLFDE